jgi:L-arabinose isomerase
MGADPGLEIWFLTGSQSMYGDQTLDQVAVQSQQIVATLNASTEVSVPVVWKPVLTTAGAIREACLAATVSDNCVGVVAWMHTFSPAKMWIGGLDALRKPLLHFHTQANLSLPWAEIDMDFMNLNQAARTRRATCGWPGSATTCAMLPSPTGTRPRRRSCSECR